MQEPPSASLLSIFLVFFRVGMFSFGGGLSGWMYREVVLLRPWLTDAEFLSGMAVSQIMPGVNVSNLSVYIGHRLRGPIGAIVAVFGLIIGPFFAVLALAAGYSTLKNYPWAEKGLDGVAAAAIGLLLIVAAKGAKRAGQRVNTAIAMAATFICVGLLRLPLILVVLCVGPLSIAAAWPRGAKQEPPDA